MKQQVFKGICLAKVSGKVIYLNQIAHSAPNLSA
jgi:hypothetical protein